MTMFRSWLERMLGLKSDIEDQLEKSVRLSTAVAGALARAEAVKEAEQYAVELEKTHPQLAMALRGEISAIVGCTLLEPVAPEASVSLAESTAKKLPARSKKPVELPPASQVPSNGGN